MKIGGPPPEGSGLGRVHCPTRAGLTRQSRALTLLPSLTKGLRGGAGPQSWVGSPPGSPPFSHPSPPSCLLSSLLCLTAAAAELPAMDRYSMEELIQMGQGTAGPGGAAGTGAAPTGPNSSQGRPVAGAPGGVAAAGGAGMSGAQLLCLQGDGRVWPWPSSGGWCSAAHCPRGAG